MSFKHQISSPLEAGTSILDAHHLPSCFTDALEYASARLARKSLRINLVAVRREYQLPPSSRSVISAPTTPASPSASARFSKRLTRWTTRHGQSCTPKSALASPAVSDISGPESPWPLSPSNTTTSMPSTPSSITSAATDRSMSSMREVEIWLMYADDLSEKAEKNLQSVMNKTSRRFGIPAIANLVRVSGLMSQLVHSSIAQNELLFSSDGICVVSLDRLYNLKSALASYSRSQYHLRLEDAVDDLRRYILANNGYQVVKADLLRSYDWLGVSTAALADLDRMYRRAYGGPDEIGGISGIMCSSATQMDFTPCQPNSSEISVEQHLAPELIGIAISTTPVPKPAAKVPTLKLQTSFEKKPTFVDEKTGEEEDDKTARPSAVPRSAIQPWNNSIAQVLSTGTGNLTPPRTSRQGPMTPNGYDDISPITRGEWGFLTTDDSFQGAKRVAVETF